MTIHSERLAMRSARTVLAVLAVLCLAIREVGAQGGLGTIQGTVRGDGGRPVSDVTVLVVGTRNGAVSRADGRFTITSVPAGVRQLHAARIGYSPVTQSVTVTTGQTVTVALTMTAAATSLEQVVVTGYATQVKRDVTGSVSTIAGDEIATMPVPTVDEALAGLSPGVQVQTTNTQPGTDMRIRIRGSNSLNGSNDPLIVIDGVIGADINQLNPNEIESVNILKDASAAAIYGARASNGVVLITTKTGEPGRMRFAYSGYAGTQGVAKKMGVLTADEFARLFMRNPNHDKSITFDTTGHLASTDWQDVIFRAAPIQNHQLQISGSTGGTKMFLSGALFNQQGVLVGSTLARGSLRFNLDQDIGERLRVGTRVTYSRTLNNLSRVNDGYGSAGGPVTSDALRFAPTIPVYDSLGNFSGPLISSQTMDNPLAVTRLKANKRTTNYLIGDLFGEYDLLPGVTARSSLGYTSADLLQQQYTSRLLYAALGQGQANINNSGRTNWLSENTLTAQHRFGAMHDVSLMGGFTAEQTNTSGSSEQGVGFTSDELGYNRLNLATTVTGNSNASQDRLASFLGRANYSFGDKYLLTATLRRDGASKFAANNKWATFPSGAFAWRIIEEPFFRRVAPVVSDAKIRLSAGRTGSEAISDYQSLAAWSIGAPYAIGTTTYNNGATPSRNANPNLRWETTTQYDAGLDLALFSNRVSLTVDAYTKKTNDLLYDKETPYYTAYADYTTNIGSVQNRGLEVQLDTRHSIGAAAIRLGGNIAFNRSKVLDLGGDQQIFFDGVDGSLPRFRPAAIVQVGEPLGNFWGYIWDGIFQDSASAASSGQAGARPGGDKLRDRNGDGKIDSNDLTILGNAQPKYIFGQLGSVVYKAFTVSYLVRGSIGFKIANLDRQGMESPGSSTNQVRSVLDYWTPENHSNTANALGLGPYDGMTSRWIEDGSFVRIQNVTASWDIPPRLSNRLNMSSAQLYVSVQNLHTFTSYSGYDPEVSSRGTSDLQLGWDDNSYPGVRTVTFGWNVRF